MPSKIQLDENLVFLYICLQKSDMKTIDFAAVGQTTNLKSPAARMRYTRLKRQIEKGVIGANANINLGSGGDERERNGEEKEGRKEKREKKMREKAQKEEKREREGVEKKERVEAKEWNRVESGMGMEMKMYGGVEIKGKRKREIGDTTESDADAISEPDFQLQGWKNSILNNTTSLFPADLPPPIRLSTHPQSEHFSHPYLHNYPATSAPQPIISQSDFSESQPISHTHPNQLPSQTSSSPALDPQIKLEPYSPFSSFSSHSTERSLPNLHERIDDEDADSEDEMPLAKRRGLGKRQASRSQSQSQSPHGNENGNPNPSREESSHTDASKIAEGYAHSHSHSHSCSEMSDLRESGCADEYTYTHSPLRSSTHEPGTSQYAYAYPNPYTTPYKSIYTPPASYETLESLNSTLLAPLPSPPLPSKSTATPSNPPPYPYNWADTYQSYRHLWGTERIARVSPPPPSQSLSTSSCPSPSSSLPLPLYHNHNHNHNHNYNHNHTPTPSHSHTHNHNKITNANTIPDSDFPAPLPNSSPGSNTHPLSSQW
ncbi:hypothetical protein EAF00_010498 [Botryotinia globosa]|nr:hypothetical protein EAF00_010498 [Botryotinia globosa]